MATIMVMFGNHQINKTQVEPNLINNIRIKYKDDPVDSQRSSNKSTNKLVQHAQLSLL